MCRVLLSNPVHEDPVTKSKRVTNSAGAKVSTIELDPWGADTTRSNNADAFQPKKFTSYERDGNGSDEAMFRRYNRWHSRFDQPDPYDGSYSLTNPQSFNRYAYVQNDPVNATDPSGLEMDATGGCSAMYSSCAGSGGGGYDGTPFDSGTYEYGGGGPTSEHIAQALARSESIRTTGYDPAFDRYWGDTTVTRTDAQGNVVSTQTLHNATQYEVVIAYLAVADLLRFVDGKITAHGSGSSFGVTFNFLNDQESRDAVMAILHNTKIFNSGPFGLGHMKDVGATSHGEFADFRFVNGVFGKEYPRSLEVAINTRKFAAYADTDRYDFYGGLAPATAHLFLEFFPNKIKRIFGGGR